ncbi:hypothetical protein BH23GEM9_BH23GEM9_08970 [soil metagenome]
MWAGEHRKQTGTSSPSLRKEVGIDQQIRFAQTPDGVRIAYAVAGQGLPLVRAAHWLSHLEFDWRTSLWHPWLTGMAQRWTLIRYDQRGCGLSDRDTDGFSLDDWVCDLETVVDACGLERFALAGMSQGGPVAIAYAAKHPERVSHLILYGTYLRGRQAWSGSPQREVETETLLRLIELGWGQPDSPYAEVFASQFLRRPDTEQRREFTELQRLSASRATAAAIIREFDAVDVTELARRLVVPTLVMHARGDARVPFDEGRRVASIIPGARLVALDGANHVLQASDPALDQFLDAASEFLSTTADTAVRSRAAIAALTRRERDVLELIARGCDNRNIAERLFISPATVRNYITRLFAKLAVRNRAEAIVLARRTGLGLGPGVQNREPGP